LGGETEERDRLWDKKKKLRFKLGKRMEKMNANNDADAD